MTKILVQCPVTPKTPWGMLLSTHAQVELAQEIGADGIDWWPYRIPQFELKYGLIRDDDLPYIGSCHQSFRGETLQSAFLDLKKGNWRGAIFSAEIVAIMPYYYDSLSDIVKLNKLTPNIPSVVYQNRWWDGHLPYKEIDQISTRLIQPSQEYVERFGVSSLPAFVEYAEHSMYDYCLDLFHMHFIRKSDGSGPIGTWEEIMSTLMPHTRLVHLGAGRVDFTKEQTEAGIDSMEWLSSLLRPDGQSRIWEMLWWIKTHGYSKIPIVLEIPALGLDALFKYKSSSRFLSRADYVNLMSQIVRNIRKYTDL